MSNQKNVKTYLSGAFEMYFAWNSVTFSGTSVQRIAYRRDLAGIGNRWECKLQQCHKKQNPKKLLSGAFKKVCLTLYERSSCGFQYKELHIDATLGIYILWRDGSCNNPWLEMAKTKEFSIWIFFTSSICVAAKKLLAMALEPQLLWTLRDDSLNNHRLSRGFWGTKASHPPCPIVFQILIAHRLLTQSSEALPFSYEMR